MNELTMTSDDASSGDALNRNESTLLDDDKRNDILNRNESTMLEDEQSDQAIVGCIAKSHITVSAMR